MGELAEVLRDDVDVPVSIRPHDRSWGNPSVTLPDALA